MRKNPYRSRLSRVAECAVLISASACYFASGVQAQHAAEQVTHNSTSSGTGAHEHPKAAKPQQAGFFNCFNFNKNKGTAEAKPAADTKLAAASLETTINVPREYVWQNLTDFDHYPHLFPRMVSCKVLKQDERSVYLETHLKPQMFVKETCQHTINEIHGKPEVIRWNMVDGTFKSATGEWKLTPGEDGRSCKVRYTLQIDPGPAIPRPVAAMALKMVQREIVTGVKQTLEKDFKNRPKQTASRPNF